MRKAMSTVFSDDDVRLSGKETIERLHSLIAELSKSVPLGGRVGISFSNSAAEAIAILAVFSSERVPVMLHPQNFREKSVRSVESLRLHALVGPHYLAKHLLTNLKVPVFLLDIRGQIAWKSNVREHPVAPFPRYGTGLILYTSGSTGEPKGVQLPMSGLLHIATTLIKIFRLDVTTHAVIALPMHHTMALNTHFLPTVLVGGSCHFISGDMRLGNIYQDFVDANATFVALISDMLPVLAHERVRRKTPHARSVKQVQLAGGIIQTRHLLTAQELFPNAIVYKGYGLTEAVRVAMMDSRNPYFHSELVGKTIPGQTLRICDSNGKALPPESFGEVYVGGRCLMLGYEDEIRLKLVNGFLATGDCGCITKEGYLAIHGRKDSIFKSHGRRIAAAEIESVAMRDANVRVAKCIPVPSELKGLRPVLFIEPMPGADHYFLSDGQNAFEETLRSGLHSYKIPRDIFVLERLPRRDGGKLSLPRLGQYWDLKDHARVLGVGKHGCRFLGGPLVSTRSRVH